MSPALVLMAIMLAPEEVPTPVPESTLRIIPAENSKNPVNVQQLVVLGVEGIEDLKTARVYLWPREGVRLDLVLASKQVEGDPRWYEWNATEPRILFVATQPGKYLIGVKVTPPGQDFVWAEYEIDVGGEPPPKPNITIQPVEGFKSEGPVGGPFAPRLKEYTLKAENGDIEWTANSLADWVVPMPDRGVVEQDKTMTVELFVTTAANVLPTGEHQATVEFTAAGRTVTRLVTLTVGKPEPPPPPPITKLWGLIIYESDDLTNLPASQAKLIDTPTVEFGMERGTLFVKDKDIQISPHVKKGLTLEVWKSWKEHIINPDTGQLQPGKTLPWFVLYDQDGRKIYNDKCPLTIEATKKIIVKYQVPRKFLGYRRKCRPNGSCYLEPVYSTAP